MSYARFGWRGPNGGPGSEVYVFMCVTGALECCACKLGGEERFSSTEAMIVHLREHIIAGHAVPDDVIPALEADREGNDAFIRGGGA